MLYEGRRTHSKGEECYILTGNVKRRKENYILNEEGDKRESYILNGNVKQRKGGRVIF
jgi:hypothetical protein